MNRDVLIDDVARQMTDGHPSDDLRARVTDRLGPAPQRGWLRRFAPAAAIAGLAAMALFSRPADDPGTVAPTSATPPLVASAARRGVVPPTAGSVSPTGTAVVRRGPELTRQVSADELAWHARTVPPLLARPALLIDPIQPTRVSIAPMTVEPLATDPLALPPLASRSGTRQ